MTQENNNIESSGASEEKLTGLSETTSQNWKDFLQFESMPKELEEAGTKVFVWVSILSTFFIFAFNIFGGEQDFEYLRASEFLIKILAAGLIVALVGKSKNVIALISGIFLIGALIVPAKDIISFFLVVNGGDYAETEETSDSYNVIDLQGRGSDVANKIITELVGNELMDAVIGRERKIALRIIEDELENERAITLLEQARSQGAVEALVGSANDIQAAIYKYRDQVDFIDHLKYLRSKDLIRYPYNDFESIELTSLGKRVVELYTGASESGLSAIGLQNNNCPSAVARISGGTAEEISIVGDSTWYEYTAGDDGRIKVTLDSIEGDAYLELLKAEQGDCIYVADDDDSGGDWNALIDSVITSEGDIFYIGVSNYDETRTSATLKVESL